MRFNLLRRLSIFVRVKSQNQMHNKNVSLLDIQPIKSVLMRKINYSTSVD